MPTVSKQLATSKPRRWEVALRLISSVYSEAFLRGRIWGKIGSVVAHLLSPWSHSCPQSHIPKEFY